MSDTWKFLNPKGIYFVSFAVVEWTDVFENDQYVQIVIDSLRYCQEFKGMEIYSWVIMPDHLHLIFRSVDGLLPGKILGDFKRHTSKAIVKAIKSNFQDKNRIKYLKIFSRNANRVSNVQDYQFWRHDNRPTELWSPHIIQIKINYIHKNPVKKGIVDRPEDYLYSSARNYTGNTGLIDIVDAGMN